MANYAGKSKIAPRPVRPGPAVAAPTGAAALILSEVRAGFKAITERLDALLVSSGKNYRDLEARIEELEQHSAGDGERLEALEAAATTPTTPAKADTPT